ncbi:MAG: hypothetical protein H6Q75_600 [Firmicutes bacterium]|nr:hypothetical protein [Bacillota bacterium]
MLTSSPRSGSSRNQAGSREERDSEQFRRYCREVQKEQKFEDALHQLSVFHYEPVDYSMALLEKKFIPTPIPNFDYLLAEARLKVTNKFYTPIAVQLLLAFFCAFISLTFKEDFVTTFGIVGLVLCVIFLYKDLNTRQQKIDSALAAARVEIDARTNAAIKKIESDKKHFEQMEEARLIKIRNLVTGQPGAVVHCIERVLAGSKLPFTLQCSILYYEEELVLTLHLPDKNIIPTHVGTISQGGNLVYTEKTTAEIHKQYNEVLAATAITIANMVYAHVPTLSTVYLQGLFDRWLEEEYLFSLILSRQGLIDAVESNNGLEAFGMLNARYNNKGGLFAQIEPFFPEWWKRIPPEIRSVEAYCKQS